MSTSTTEAKYRVAAVQMEPKLGRLGDNLERILDRLGEAARAGATWSSSRNVPYRDTGSPAARKGWPMPSLSTAKT